MSRLPLGPVGIVVMPMSEVMLDPWNDHEIEKLRQMSRRPSHPDHMSVEEGLVVLGGIIIGMNKKKGLKLFVPFWTPISITTIYSQLDSLASDSCLV